MAVSVLSEWWSAQRQAPVPLISCLVAFWAVAYAAFVMFYRSRPALGLADGRKAMKAASRSIGILHATYCVLVSSYVAYAQYPHYDYTGPTSLIEFAIVIVSATYFFVDFWHFVAFEWDALLLLHHIISGGYAVSVMWNGWGGTAVCVALWLGEITNPLQSVWTIAKAAGNVKLYDRLSLPFTIAFVFARWIVTPILVFDILKHYATTPAERLPSNMNYPLMFTLPILMTLGGWIWAVALVRGLLKFYKKKRALKAAAAALAKEEANGTAKGEPTMIDALTGVNDDVNGHKSDSNGKTNDTPVHGSSSNGLSNRIVPAVVTGTVPHASNGSPSGLAGRPHVD